MYFQVEVELLKEDNEQLVTQYEREKQLRKANEQRNLEIEDQYEGERKEMAVKIDSMSSIVKMFELKAKNSTDQITRLEDKEAEMKKEYSKLHDRYTDLFKTHMDYMERSKAVMGSERLEQMMSMGSARQRIAGMSLNQLNRWEQSPDTSECDFRRNALFHDMCTASRNQVIPSFSTKC